MSLFAITSPREVNGYSEKTHYGMFHLFQYLERTDVRGVHTNHIGWLSEWFYEIKFFEEKVAS